MYIAEVYDGISIWTNDTAGGDVSAVVRHLDNHQSCTGKGGADARRYAEALQNIYAGIVAILCASTIAVTLCEICRSVCRTICPAGM